MTFLIAFYTFSVFAVLFLVWRIVRRRRRERPALLSAQPTVSTAVELAPVEPQPVPPGEPSPARPSSSSRPVAVSWGERVLFADAQHARSQSAEQFPEVDLDDVPGIASDDELFGPLTRTLAACLPESPARRDVLQKELQSAGFYQRHAWQNLAAVRYLGLLLPMIVFGALLLVVPPALEPYMLVMLVVGPLVGWAVPRLYVRSRAARRLVEIERAMPDMLDMLNMCVSQGMTVQESLKRVSRELRRVFPALAQELRILTTQAEIGGIYPALGALSRRVNVAAVHSFATLLMQTERMGTSVSTALVEYSDTMREGLKQRADETANRAAFRLLFPTVLCLMPAVYLFLLGPAIIELSDFFTSGGRDALDSGSQAIQRMNR